MKWVVMMRDLTTIETQVCVCNGEREINRFKCSDCDVTTVAEAAQPGRLPVPVFQCFQHKQLLVLPQRL